MRNQILDAENDDETDEQHRSRYEHRLEARRVFDFDWHWLSPENDERDKGEDAEREADFHSVPVVIFSLLVLLIFHRFAYVPQKDIVYYTQNGHYATA